MVFSIYAFTGVLTVVLGVILLKESDVLGRKIAGALISLLGILLVNR